MSVLAYITDLFSQAKVSETAKLVDIEVNIVSSLFNFLPELGKRRKPPLILIDFNAQGISASALISQIKESYPELPLIAFGDPLDRARMDRAGNAGADQVLARETFFEKLPALLERYATVVPEPAPQPKEKERAAAGKEKKAAKKTAVKPGAERKTVKKKTREKKAVKKKAAASKARKKTKKKTAAKKVRKKQAKKRPSRKKVAKRTPGKATKKARKKAVKKKAGKKAARKRR